MNDSVHYQRLPHIPGLVLGAGRFAKFDFGRHYHLDYHIGIVTEGVQRQQYKGETQVLGPGFISLMPPGEIHDGACDSDAYTLRTFRVSQKLMLEASAELSDAHTGPELLGNVFEDPQTAARLFRLHNVMCSEAVSTLAIQSEWLSVLDALFTQTGAIRSGRDPNALSHAQWRRMQDYCLANLSEKITLDDLATLCGLGRFLFLRQFKRTVGMTPHAWLLRLRLEQACALLTQGSLSVAHIAQRVGFYDQSHFNRAFKQAFGVAPSGY
ncbi:AraC-type DNA-binding domain-containing protein [Hahella chejuensis KCTC 2396]|uniref:AraC-type DNA-binding domain-containing protein n=1 Tax=Hahella chejuensis (strain KCTC 2396) TaxID=349521 RepID=Q2SHC9_HAHCH|nr:AraC family transcriptional regulator [Hahella chejuensis]ABC29945.1 AraC-type DNA-binding domain-containing protein [Hahella chejuensis KCTC 2396]